MTSQYLIRRSLAAGVTFAVATAALGVFAGGTALAGPRDPGHRDGSVRNAGVTGVVKDSYIVVLKDKAASPNVVQDTASSLSRVHGGVVKRTYSSALKGYLAQMSAAQAKRVAAQPEVAYVEQNRVVKADAVAPQPSPPSWGLDRIDQTYLPLDGSYTAPNTAGNVHVYVIDSGININHTEFAPGRATYGQNFAPHNYKELDEPGYGADPITAGDASDCGGHGTHVAGTVGGNMYGVAKGVSLVAVRVLNCIGTGTEAQIIDGIGWVKTNAVQPAVANMSLGSFTSTAINDAVKAATDAGVTFVVSAGNNGFDACRKSPASAPSAITVGATSLDDSRVWYSNFGTCVDVFAPGEDITSAWIGDTNSETNTIGGTSMATPHVAGAAAMLLSATPGLTPAQVQSTIVGGAVTGAVSNTALGSPNKLLQVGAAAAAPGTVLRLRAGANNQVVVAESGGNLPLIANRTVTGAWEEFEVVPSGDPDNSVGLRSRANGRFVTAESGGNAPLVARGTALSLWEKFVLTDTDGVITLKAVVNGKYVTAESAGGRPLIANRDAAGPWEQFTVAAPSTVVAMYSYAHAAPGSVGDVWTGGGSWVSADGAGARPLIANRDEPYGWETFDLVDLGNGNVALRSWANGRYVTAESAGARPLIANRTSVGLWETFQLATNADGSSSLKANANGKFVTADSGGGAPLVANRTSVGQWETFDVIGW
jgi:subtilisin family serine protease